MADQITDYPGSIPDRSQSQSTFDTNADAWLSWFTDTAVGEINTLATSVETDATNAETSATNAATSASAAAASAGLNNFQGTYAGGTTYATGESVIYSDRFYLSLVSSNTGNTPDSSPSQWQDITATAIEGFTLGTESVFESADTDSISIAVLSGTKAIVAYVDAGNSSYGTACILDLSTLTITPGSAAVFESATTSEVGVAALSATQSIVCYKDGGNSNYGTSCILDVSGSTITPGTAAVYESAASDYNHPVKLSSTKALVTYAASSNGRACILDVSGSTITPGTAVTYDGGAITYGYPSVISSTKAVVVYPDPSATSKPTSVVLDVSGSTITPGTPLQLANLANVTMTMSCAIDSSTFLAFFRCASSQGYSNVVQIVNISGSTLSTDERGIHLAQPDSDNAATLPADFVQISATRYALGLRYAAQGACAHEVIILDYDSTLDTLTIVDREFIAQYFYSAPTYVALCHMGSGTLIYAFDNESNSNYGTARAFSYGEL